MVADGDLLRPLMDEYTFAALLDFQLENIGFGQVFLCEEKVRSSPIFVKAKQSLFLLKESEKVSKQ